MNGLHAISLALSAPLLGMFVLIGLSVRRYGAVHWVGAVGVSWLTGVVDALGPDWQWLAVGLGSLATVLLVSGAAAYGGRSLPAAVVASVVALPCLLAGLVATVGAHAGYVGLALSDSILLLVAARLAWPPPALRDLLAARVLPFAFLLYILPVLYFEIRRAQGGSPDEPTLVIASGLTLLAAIMLVVLTARVVRDETLQRRGLEARLVEREDMLEQSLARARSAERLAAVGTLAAGIAHQINNPIGAILLVAQSELRDSGEGPADPSSLRRTLATIEGEALRCAQIVRNVLLFARTDPGRVADHDLNDIAESARAATLDQARQRGARIELERSGRPAPVQGNAVELEQVLVNLIRNGIESRPDGATVRMRVEASAGGAAVVVEDDGHGVRPEARERLFEPFYTTRLKEGGSGLGLAVVHGILSTHGGAIELVATGASGSCFRVSLPAPNASD